MGHRTIPRWVDRRLILLCSNDTHIYIPYTVDMHYKYPYSDLIVEISIPNDRIPNDTLLEAGLSLMKQAGRDLKRVKTGTRSMQYVLPGGESVRVRTCNDHVLVALAGSPKKGAPLNIEGTDYLLIVMPEIPRTHGSVIAYFIPTKVAVEAVRRSHAEWLASNPNTKGKNRTWNVWFDETAMAGGFAKKWVEYRLPGSASTSMPKAVPAFASASASGTLGEVIAAAKQQIADAASVPVHAVKITIELG